MPSGSRYVLLASGFLCLSLLASGCGGSSGSHVAQLGTVSTTTGPGGASTAGGSPASAALGYARCMRSHGVLAFPDPSSSGQIPKTQVVNAREANPSRFDAANTSCRHLLPNGGNGETPAQIAQDWVQFRKFARCMRSHGVPNWPDPTNRSTSDHRPDFNLAASGLDPNSPQLKTKAQQCSTLLHMGGLPAAH